MSYEIGEAKVLMERSEITTARIRRSFTRMYQFTEDLNKEKKQRTIQIMAGILFAYVVALFPFLDTFVRRFSGLEMLAMFFLIPALVTFSGVVITRTLVNKKYDRIYEQENLVADADNTFAALSTDAFMRDLERGKVRLMQMTPESLEYEIVIGEESVHHKYKLKCDVRWGSKETVIHYLGDGLRFDLVGEASEHDGLFVSVSE